MGILPVCSTGAFDPLRWLGVSAKVDFMNGGELDARQSEEPRVDKSSASAGKRLDGRGSSVPTLPTATVPRLRSWRTQMAWALSSVALVYIQLNVGAAILWLFLLMRWPGLDLPLTALKGVVLLA